MADYTFDGDPAEIFPFVCIDEDAIGDGGTNALPYDTWLLNRLNSNNRDLARLRNAVMVPSMGGTSQTPGVHSGFRPAGAISGWVQIHGADVAVERGCTGCVVTIHGAIVGFGSDGASLDIRVDFGGKQTIATFGPTSGYSDEAGVFEVEVSLPQPTKQLEVLPFSVWVRSEDDGENSGKGSLDVEPRGYAFAPASSSDASFFDESATTSPTSDSLDVQYCRITDGSDPDGTDFDMLSNVVSTGSYGASVWPSPVFDGYTLTFRYMSVLLERACFVELVYTRDSVANVPKDAISAIDRAGLRKVAGAESIARIALGVRQLYKRPINHFIGPRGALNSADEPYSGQDYPIIWPFVRGNDTAKTLFTELIFPQTDNPTIMVLVQCVGVHLRQPNSKTKGSAAGLSGLANWDLTLTVDQLDDVSGLADWEADSIEYGSSEATIPFTLWPAFAAGNYPFLRFAHFTESWDAAYQSNFAHFEGRLFEDDLDLVERGAIACTLAGYSGAVAGRPLRVKLQAVLNTDTAPEYVTNQNATAEFLRLYCVRFSIVEFPSV